MKLYHTSPAYLAYLQAKNKGKLNQVEDREPHERSTGGGKQAAADRRIEIQPAEDEEGTLLLKYYKLRCKIKLKYNIIKYLPLLIIFIF